MKTFLLLFFSTFFVFILLEFVVRIFFPQNLIYNNNDIWRPDDLYGWRHYENVNTKINGAGAGVVNFVSDENGFRVNINQNDDGVVYKYEILALGDSFLEALQVENEDTFIELAKKDITIDGNVNFYNSGVGGWDPNHYLIQTKEILRDQIVNLGIIFFYVGNDVVDYKSDNIPAKKRSASKFHFPNDFSYRSFIKSVLKPLNDRLEKKSHLFLFLKDRFSNLLTRLGLSARYFPSIFYINEKNDHKWETSVEICYDIDQQFKKFNIPTMFVLLPTPYQYNEEVFIDYVRSFSLDVDSIDIYQPQKILTDLMTKKNMNVFDPLPFMKNKGQAIQFDLYGKIDNHFNKNGHSILSEYLIKEIEDILKVKE